MLVKDYQAKLLGIIQNYLDSRIVITYNFSVDNRSSYIALIQGKLEFKDGSHLFFKEFINLQEYLEKLSYSFTIKTKKITSYFVMIMLNINPI